MKTGPVLNNDNSCTFHVWAPEKEEVILHIVHPFDKEFRMKKGDEGYFSLRVDDIHDGCRYYYNPGCEKDLPDPGSHYQPGGVHGPSQVIDHSSFQWTDNDWKGTPLKELVFYELHTGTFTPEGTFEAVIPMLHEIKDTGFTAIEIMPVCQFPGSRNWGYDGVYPYSVQNSYGGPDGLKKLVDACHAAGLSVFLDVVYNHMGPEGNYFSLFGPYFTKKYQVPWGDAINMDDEWSNGVRDFFSCNPCFWFSNFHIDGIRADAIHAIFDSGAVHFWEVVVKRINELEEKLGRRFYMIAESDLNSPRVIKPVESGGFGFDAQWLDDFHHVLYVILHREGKSRYEDFGSLEQLAKSYSDGFVHSGEFVRFRKRNYGASSAGIPGDKFVVFNQNHDQIGNRVMGERLTSLVSFDKLMQASAAILLSPYLPLMFMGEEYGEDNPFLYFVNHSDEELVQAVREGRKKEFSSFRWEVEPPDPQDESTFSESIIDWNKRYSGKYRTMLEWNMKLLRIRKNHPAMRNFSKDGVFVYLSGQDGLGLVRRSEDKKNALVCFMNVSDKEISFTMPPLDATWEKIIDSSSSEWREDNTDNAGNVIPGKAGPGETIKCAPGTTIVFSSFPIDV